MDPIEQIFAQIQHSGPASAIAAGAEFGQSFRQARSLQREDRRLDQQDTQLQQQGEYQRAQLGFARMREQREAGQETRAAEGYEYGKTLRPLIEESHWLGVKSAKLDYERKLIQQRRDVQVQEAEGEAAMINYDAGLVGWYDAGIQQRMRNLAAKNPAIFSTEAGKAIIGANKISPILLQNLFNNGGQVPGGDGPATPGAASGLPPNSSLMVPLPGGARITVRGADPVGEARLKLGQDEHAIRSKALDQRVREYNDQLPPRLKPIYQTMIQALYTGGKFDDKPDDFTRALNELSTSFYKLHKDEIEARRVTQPGATNAPAAQPGTAPAVNPNDPLGLFK